MDPSLFQMLTTVHDARTSHFEEVSSLGCERGSVLAVRFAMGFDLIASVLI
jgi:hypothetical protein